MSAGNMKTCPNCKAKNLDFKIYCGECGSSLAEPVSASDVLPAGPAADIGARKYGILESIAMALRTSSFFGIMVMVLPLVFTYFTLDLIVSLSYQGLVAPALLYGAELLLIIELIFLFGCLIFNREYRLGYVEPPVRGMLVFLITFSVAPYMILVMTSQFGRFALEYAALIVLGVAAFSSWLLFFGWLGEPKPGKSHPRKVAEK